jgi:hypothetical protein
VCRFNVWIDEVDIPGGSAWRADIAKAIGACDAVVFLESRASVNSEHCRNELALARDKKRPILSVFLEPVDVPGELQLMLSRFQHITYDAPASVEVFDNTVGRSLRDRIGAERRAAP